MMSKVRLKFHSVGEIVGSDDLAIITLTDEPKERMITIVCDRAMAVQMELRSKQIPITRIMLPEVLAGIIKDQAGIMMDILIMDIIEGQYRTLLYNRVTLETLPIRASDAVLLSMVSPHSYLYGILVDGSSECTLFGEFECHLDACQHAEHRDARQGSAKGRGG